MLFLVPRCAEENNSEKTPTSHISCAFWPQCVWQHDRSLFSLNWQTNNVSGTGPVFQQQGAVFYLLLLLLLQTDLLIIWVIIHGQSNAFEDLYAACKKSGFLHNSYLYFNGYQWIKMSCVHFSVKLNWRLECAQPDLWWNKKYFLVLWLS